MSGPIPAVRPAWSSPDGAWVLLWFDDRVSGGPRLVRRRYAAAVVEDIWARFRAGECSNLETRRGMWFGSRRRPFGPPKILLDVGGSVCLDRIGELPVAHLDGLDFVVWEDHVVFAGWAVQSATRSPSTGLHHVRLANKTLLLEAYDRDTLEAGLVRLAGRHRPGYDAESDLDLAPVAVDVDALAR